MNSIAYHFLLLVAALLSSCSHNPKAGVSNSHLKVSKLGQPPKIGTTISGQHLFLGGFSALKFLGRSGSKISFSAITDRGPNPEAFSYLGGVGRNVRPILLPDFAPSLVNLSLDTQTNEIEIISVTPFRLSASESITGLPPHNTSSEFASKNPRYEIAANVFGKVLNYRNAGIDSEGVCRFKNTYLVAEEYGPQLLQFDSNLIELKRWSPGQGLPRDLIHRKINRGFEGLDCDENFAYLILQSPLKSGLDKDVNQIRLLQFSPQASKTINEYFYPVEAGGADKIGDIALLAGQKFLIIEQNGKLGQEDGIRKIYQVDLAMADKDGRLTKKLILDLNKVGFDFVEKIEGLAVIDQNTLALITDNDFGIESQIELSTGKFNSKLDANSYLAIIHLDQPLR